MGPETLENLEVGYDPRVCIGLLSLQLSRDHKLVAPREDVPSGLLSGQNSVSGVYMHMCTHKCNFNSAHALWGPTITPILLTCLVTEGT